LFAIVSSAVVLGALTVPATAQAPSPDNCPEAVPADQIVRGMTGKGWTVDEGRTRKSFSAEVLGVLENALGPGRDMIIVDTSGEVIEDHNGIWAGISGSPIFVGDKLLGSVSFGLAFGPETVAGVTPATEMMKVLGYPTDQSPAPMARRARLTHTIRERIAYSTGSDVSEVSNSVSQLKLPVSVSGASNRQIDSIASVFQRENLPLIPYAGSSASGAAVQGSPATLRPGDNIGTALSYGDTTFAAVGSVTFVCGDRVMAFGHPFLWEGGTTMGINASSSIAVIHDPFGAFEMGTIDEGLGRLDQDRFAGVRGVFGPMPSSIPVTSSVTALNTNRQRDGRTDVLVSEMLPFIAYNDVFGTILMTMDQYTEGSAEMSWTVTGTTESGGAWSFTRSNMHSSEFGIADESSFEIVNFLSFIEANQFEPVEFTSFDFDVTADDEIKQYTITDVHVSKDGVQYKDKRRIKAQPGSEVFLRILLSPHGEGDDKVVDLTVQVPARARTDGYVEIRGGALSGVDAEVCFYDPAACVSETGKKIKSFDDLLTFLGSRPKNNELIAKLRMGGGKVKSEAAETLDQVVFGEALVRVRIPGACCGGRNRGGGSSGGKPGPVEEEPPVE
jgi:hypothetical protein